MDGKNIIETDNKYIANTYARYNVVFEEGEGCLLKDIEGKEYIDCASGIGVNIFGANDEQWKAAVTEQINKIQHVCNLYYAEPQAKLAELLCKKTGASKVFFGNSGAEANECAIKIARKYGNTRYGRNEIITLKNSFHGRTMATLAATGQDEFHKFYQPFPEGFKYADANESGILSCYTDKTCAVMIETIQGEGGVINIDGEFLKWLQKFCNERDILLIVDEVQTGNGRTGYLYSYQAYGLKPDVVTTAKGLGGGLPIGACLIFDKCKSVFGAGDHGSTFGGNPVACAGAYNILSRITDELLLEIQGKSAYFRAQLARIRNVKKVSGLGLIIGIECTKPAREVAQSCLDKGLVVLTAHSTVRLLPPLTISKQQIDKSLKILNEVIGQ